MHLRQISSWRPELRPSQFPFVSALSWLGRVWQGDREVQSHIHKGQTDWKIRAEGGLGWDVATGRATDYSVPFSAQTNASHQCFPPAVSPTLLPKIPTKTSNTLPTITSHQHFLPKLATKLLPTFHTKASTNSSHHHFPSTLHTNFPTSASHEYSLSVLPTNIYHQCLPPTHPTNTSHQIPPRFPINSSHQHV